MFVCLGYRLELAPGQAEILSGSCGHARYVWNLCVEQESGYRPGRGRMPGFAERCRQLTEARADNPWLAAGSATVQQQAIKDHDQAMRNFFGGTHGRPTWRRAGQHEGFRIIAVKPSHIRRLNRKTGEVFIPKAGWVRFRWSRPVPDGAKSFRVTCDRAGRWHVAFAAIPGPVPAPGNGEVAGVDRGIRVTVALSTGEMLAVPGLSDRERHRVLKLQRKLARAEHGSNRRGKVKLAIAKVKAREADRRKDWAEKTSTDLARRFDVIRVEDLNIGSMTRSAKGTREQPGRNVAQKAANWRSRKPDGASSSSASSRRHPDGSERVPAAYTSQRCSACGHVDKSSRESQALFLCTACGHTANADVNAAINIAAGHAVKAREATGSPGL